MTHAIYKHYIGTRNISMDVAISNISIFSFESLLSFYTYIIWMFNIYIIIAYILLQTNISCSISLVTMFALEIIDKFMRKSSIILLLKYYVVPSWIDKNMRLVIINNSNNHMCKNLSSFTLLVISILIYCT